MLRLIIGGALCACSMYIGYGIRKYYSERAKVFRQMLGLIDRLIEEISFLKPPLGKILSEFDCSGEFGKIIGKYGILIKSKAMIDSASVAPIVKSLYFNNRERELVSGMFVSLGTLDTVTQIHNLNNYKSRFATISADCDGKAKTIGALSFKLGVLCGILIMILLA